MYLVTVRYKGDAYGPHTYLSQHKGLFDLLWVLNESNLVHSFKVSNEGGACNHKQFGWAGLKKWVQTLYPLTSESIERISALVDRPGPSAAR
jgi:hypothetical protein